MFFSVQDIFLPGIFLHEFFLSKLLITPSKVKWSPLKSTKYLVNWQILIFQSFLTAFETMGDKTLQGREEEFVSAYPYPESPYGRTNARTVTS